MSIFKNHYFKVFMILIFPIQFTYSRDWPQSLSTVLQQEPYNYTLARINLMYTFTSAGLLLIIFKLGAIFDKIPIKISLIVIPVINMLVQLTMALLFYFNMSYSYYLVLVCRVIFGIVGQSFFILQTIAFIKLFKQKAIVYIGFGSSFGSLGSPLNSMISPLTYDLKHNIFFPLFICFLTSIVFIGIGLIIAKILNENLIQITPKFLLNSEQQSKSNTFLPKSQIESSQKSIWTQIRQLPLQFWILLLFAFIIISNTIGFVTIAYDLFVKRFGIQYSHANYLFIIPYTISAISSFGWKELSFSWRDCLICLSLLLLIFNITLYFMPNVMNSTPDDYIYYIIFLMVIGMCLGGCSMKVFPSLFCITKPENAGAIAGSTAMAVSLMYLTVPFICSLIVDEFDSQAIGYKYLSLVFFTPLSILTLILAMFIKLSKKFQLLDR